VRPNLVVSFMTSTNVLTILAAQGSGVRVVACEHTDPRHQKLNIFWSALRIATYPLADTVTFLTSNVLERWKLWLSGNARLMPNPVSMNATGEAVALNHSHNLIAAGRLIELKGFDMLIDAFAAIAGKHEDWGLTILGEGAMRTQLEQQVNEAGLTGQIQLPGRVKNAHSWFAQSDIYVLSSRYEGLPCALCEAMGCGTPAISFDCESGPRDIIRDGIDGLLVPSGDVPALTTALDKLMTDRPSRERLRSRAPEVQQRFGISQILELWDQLFASLGVAGL
jgi:glycosyltransferase involved in cell wall biosynthesis